MHPDWQHIRDELTCKNVTLFLLWQEYRQATPYGYQYSWFCEHYRVWRGKLDLMMRQDHWAGEKLFVDYAGQTVPVIDRTTRDIHEAQVFVAVMGASNYTYAEASWSQALPDWMRYSARWSIVPPSTELASCSRRAAPSSSRPRAISASAVHWRAPGRLP